MADYQIIDERAESRLAGLVVNPLWIVLGTMLGGVWLGWPWFVVNSLAVGSMHRTRELVTVFVGFAVTVLLTMLGLWSVTQGHLDSVSLPYAGLALVVWKLGVSYLLLLWQSPGYELAVYFRGRSRNGAVLAFAGLFIESRLLQGLPEFWQLVLS